MIILVAISASFGRDTGFVKVQISPPVSPLCSPHYEAEEAVERYTRGNFSDSSPSRLPTLCHSEAACVSLSPSMEISTSELWRGSGSKQHTQR